MPGESDPTKAQAEPDPGVWMVHAFLVDEAPTPEFVSREGFGRDVDEARTHAGWDEVPDESVERFEDVNVQDNPRPDDKWSTKVVESITRWHFDEDQETPRAVLDEVRKLIDRKLFATACAYFCDMVWDRGWEE